MLSKNIFLVGWLSLLISFALASCTRPAEELSASSQVSFAFPTTAQGLNEKMSGKISSLSLSSAKLSHVSISVTGPGIAGPMLLNWDACRNCLTATSIAPSSFQMNIPSGQGRLIQVMLVYEDADTNKMLFYYGDAGNVEVQGPVITVPVNMSQLNTGTVIEGMVAGRYITDNVSTVDVGPTGVVEIRYRPPGKPPMVVASGEIVNGWFSFFMLSGIQFEYAMRDTGLILWGGPVSLDNALFAYRPSSDTAVMRMFVPDHIFESNRNGSTSDNKSAAKIAVWGYWSGGSTAATTSVSSKKVCYTLGAFASTSNKYEMFRSTSLGTTNPAAGTDLNVSFSYGSNYPILSHLLSPDGISPPLISVDGVATPSISTSLYILGGNGPMSSSCSPHSPSSVFQNFLNINLDTQANTDSNDAVAGFSAPFIYGANNNLFTVSDSGGFKRLVGQILPGTGAPVIDGYRIYKGAGFNDDDYIDRPSCPEVVGGGTSFVLGQSTNSNINVSAGTLTIDTNIPITSSFQMATVVCPFKNNLPLNVGAAFMGSYGFGPNIAADFGLKNSVNFSETNHQYSDGVCTPIKLSGLGGPGNTQMAVFSTSGSINVSNSGMSTLFSNQDCTTAMPTNINFLPNEAFKIVYVKSTAATESLTLVSTTPAIAAKTFTLIRNPLTPTVRSQIQFMGPNLAKRGSCIPLLALLKDANGNLSSDVGSITATIAGTGGVTFHNNTACVSGTVSNISFPGSTYQWTSSTVMVKLPQTPGVVNISTTGPTGNFSITVD